MQPSLQSQLIIGAIAAVIVIALIVVATRGPETIAELEKLVTP